jgi:hypothetical protein
MASILELRLTGGVDNISITESLGGDMSNTVVPTSEKNALFTDVLEDERLSGIVTYIAVDIYNAGDADAVATILYTEPVTVIEGTALEVGIEEGTTQTIPDITAAPQDVEFAEHNILNKLDIGTIAVGTGARLWLKRTVEPATNEIPINTVNLVLEYA